MAAKMGPYVHSGQEALTWAQQAGRAGCGMSGARGGEKRGPGKTKGITDDSL